MDKDKPLQDQPFAFTEISDGRVYITHYGKRVTALAGKQAAQFLFKVAGADPHQQQLLMAKATGNFKRGNERAAKPE